jgi:hypothetical protein
MRAELKYIHSADVDDMRNYVPNDSQCFGFSFQAMLGPEGEDAEESFEMTVCTALWLDKNINDQILPLRHFLLVKEYNYNIIENYLIALARRTMGDDWKTIGERLGRVGQWEFEDYIE